MAGLVYRTALPAYRKLRQLKNRTLNLVDSPVVVLIYHRVTAPHSDPHLLAVSPDNFRSQMRYLKRNFHVVRFEEDWSGLKAPAVAVTFDDGYADNLLEALPVLEEMEIPATFFISTGTIGTREEFWWDELERIVLGKGDRPARFHLQDKEYDRIWLTGTREECRSLHEALHSLVMKIGPAQRENWLAQLRNWAGLDRIGREVNRPLAAEELQALAASPWTTIGAHSISHAPLSALSEGEQRNEIALSKKELQRIIGQEITTFSYPFGTKKHYNRTSVRLCREAGFRRAASNFPGQFHRWTDPHQIPRHLVRNWDEDTFAFHMKSFWA